MLGEISPVSTFAAIDGSSKGHHRAIAEGDRRRDAGDSRRGGRDGLPGRGRHDGLLRGAVGDHACLDPRLAARCAAKSAMPAAATPTTNPIAARRRRRRRACSRASARSISTSLQLTASRAPICVRRVARSSIRRPPRSGAKERVDRRDPPLRRRQRALTERGHVLELLALDVAQRPRQPKARGQPIQLVIQLRQDRAVFR